MPFVVIDVETGHQIQDVLSPARLNMHETGEEAQAYARRLSQQYGRKLRVKRVLDHRWKEREQRKMDSGEYQIVPWCGESWWNDSLIIAIHKYHYPHASFKEPGKLAYTESEEKGMDNIKTQIKPGRYLETYFGKQLKEWGYNVQDIALQFARAFEPRILRYASTEDEVQYVYEHGPSSCMSTERYRSDHGWGYPTKGKWPQGIHACRMYIAGDLQVAYIVDNDEKYDKTRRAATIIARSLVWPKKKTHSRVYGDEARMRGLLSAAGYTFGPPIGAKLQRIPIKDDGYMRFIVPYIDAGLRSGEGSLTCVDKKTHLEISDLARMSYSCGSTSGVSGPKLDSRGNHVENSECAECGEENVDTERVYDGTTNENTGNRNFRWLCGDCRAAAGAFFCAHDQLFYTGAIDQITMADGDIWSARAFQAAGFICQGNGSRYARNQRISVNNGQFLWSRTYFNDNGFICDASGNAYSNDHMVKMANGQRWCTNMVAQYGFNCPQCTQIYAKAERHNEKVDGQFVCRWCHPATGPALHKHRAEREATLKAEREHHERVMATLAAPSSPVLMEEAPGSRIRIRIRSPQQRIAPVYLDAPTIGGLQAVSPVSNEPPVGPSYEEMMLQRRQQFTQVMLAGQGGAHFTPTPPNAPEPLPRPSWLNNIEDEPEDE